MKKILLLIGCIFLITGCKVEYNLVINNDLTVLEYVNMTGTDEFFDTYYKSSEINVVNMVFDESRQDFLKQNGYSYEIFDGNRPYVTAKKSYTNLEQFAQNTVFYEQYFENIDVFQNDNIVTLKTSEFIPINPDSIDRYDIKESIIKIKTAYKVVDNNASSYDEKTNTYSWYIDNETTEFSINFSYDVNEIYKPPRNSNIMLIIMTIIFMIGLIGFYIVNKKKIK